MKYYICIALIFVVLTNTKAQDSTKIFDNAFATLDSMLSGKTPLSFKKAVFTTENAYLNGTLDKEWFDEEIEFLKQIAEIMIKARPIDYNENDKERIEKYSAIFQTMTDTIPIAFDSSQMYVHMPYTYDFDDIWSKQDFTKMFVSKLLKTGKGNCHSMPFLYKIIAEEMNEPAYLAIAPNHIYLKLYCNKTGWYNTELTSASFPIDAWIIASGYIPIDAVRNSLYMDTLSMEQSIAFCMLDLGKAYERKFGLDNPKFVFQCVDTALKYYPNSINGMLIKAETQKQIIEKQMKEKNVKNPEDLFSDKAFKQMFTEMEQLYVSIHQLGYRRMPDEMYKNWIMQMKIDPSKYSDKKVIYKFDNR